MLNEKIVAKLKERYNLHPLIFHRSVERAKTDVELFDILESFPNKYPVVWNDKKRCWVTTGNL